MIGKRWTPAEQQYGRGLEGLVAGETAIGRIDGDRGRFSIRGFSIEELAESASFEEVAYLILTGELPEPPALARWTRELAGWREAPAPAIDVLNRLPADSHPLAQFRTAMSVAACLIPEAEDTSTQAQWRRPARILSWTAGLAAASIRNLMGKPPVAPRNDLGYAAHFLWLVFGRDPDPDAARALETALIVQAEHGLHAAALAALVVASTGADLGSAVLAGMGALSGAIHGGASQTAFQMVSGRRDAGEARRWCRERLAERHRFPGFGHRVYKTHDPRVRILEPHARRLLDRAGRLELWSIYDAVREEVERALGPKGVFANVDSITGLIYHPIGLPVESFPIPFCLAIQTGWMAHCLEYIPEGRVIEPRTIYVPDATAEE